MAKNTPSDNDPSERPTEKAKRRWRRTKRTLIVLKSLSLILLRLIRR